MEVWVVGLDELKLVKTDEMVHMVDTRVPVPPAIARNIGIRESAGEIICLLDADCIPHSLWLRNLLRRYDDPSVNIVGGGVDFPPGNYWCLSDNIATFYQYHFSLRPGIREQLPSLNLSFRRKVWEEVGPFDERYPLPSGEDADWTTRARLMGYTLYFEPQAVVTHCPNRTSFKDFWDHAVNFGQYSVKVDERYREILGLPFIFRYWWLLLLVSPVMALWITARIFRNRQLWHFLHTLPAIYVAKIGWCWGASKRLRGKVVWRSLNP